MTVVIPVEHYGPGGLISTEQVTLNGEDEVRHLSPERVRAAYQTLRTWSIDAQTHYDDWPNKTNAQKDVVQRETIRRLGIFFDRFADLLLMEGRT
jgi:hypothetical protein